MARVIGAFSAYDRSGSNRTAFRVHHPGLMIWVEPGVKRTCSGLVLHMYGNGVYQDSLSELSCIKPSRKLPRSRRRPEEVA